MKYCKITDVPKVKCAIHCCSKHLCEEDQQRFESKFREQSNDFNQQMHIFGELVLGAYLNLRGFRVRYEYSVENKTPDWCILDKRSAVIGIVELVNFHRDKDTENEIDRQMQAKGSAVFWSRQNKNNERLYHCIWNKMQTYRPLIEKLRVLYIIAICRDWRAGVNFNNLLPCLHDNQSGLFWMYPYVNGLLYFEGNLEQYSFRYEHNPNSLQKVDLPSGVFSFVTDQGFSS